MKTRRRLLGILPRKALQGLCMLQDTEALSRRDLIRNLAAQWDEETTFAVRYHFNLMLEKADEGKTVPRVLPSSRHGSADAGEEARSLPIERKDQAVPRFVPRQGYAGDVIAEAIRRVQVDTYRADIEAGETVTLDRSDSCPHEERCSSDDARSDSDWALGGTPGAGNAEPQAAVDSGWGRDPRSLPHRQDRQNRPARSWRKRTDQ